MPRIRVDFADLHNPLFFGRNFGTKLSQRAVSGMSLQYDTDLQMLFVEYNGKFCSVPAANVGSWEPTNPADLGLKHTPVGNAEPVSVQTRPIIQPTAPVQAQVQTPGMLPQRAPQAMAPQVPIPQPRSAQVSHPVRDQVEGPSKLTSAPKYIPHTQMAIQHAERVANSGTVRAGAPAPTMAELIAQGKMGTDALPAVEPSPAVAAAPRAKRGGRKAPETKVGE